MGGSNWSDSHYASRAAHRARTGAKSFAYTDDVNKGVKPKAAHETLDPAKLKAGKRECRDSDAHPNSNPVFVGLDVTASMSTVPVLLQQKLKELMSLLLRKGYLEDPAICIAGIGDAEMFDKAPLQIGQFESGIEIENDLTNLYLENGGGGNNQESYDLALYFLARKVITDAWEKRQKKGYAFIICDESLPQVCRASIVNQVMGVSEQADIPLADLLAEVLERWELYCIVPNQTAHYKTNLQDSWKNAIGERVLFLEDPSAVVETIAGCIGVLENAVDTDGLVTDLTENGLNASAAGAVGTALAKVTPGGGALAKVTGGDTGLSTL